MLRKEGGMKSAFQFSPIVGARRRERKMLKEREKKKGNSLSKMTGACKENKRLYKKRRMGMKSKT
jgi:hypothetical protein